MFENKKKFAEPECEITKLLVADVITTSDDEFIDEGDWGGGEF